MPPHITVCAIVLATCVASLRAAIWACFLWSRIASPPSSPVIDVLPTWTRKAHAQQPQYAPRALDVKPRVSY